MRDGLEKETLNGIHSPMASTLKKSSDNILDYEAHHLSITIKQENWIGLISHEG